MQDKDRALQQDLLKVMSHFNKQTKKSHCVVFQLTKVSSLLTAAHFGLTAFTTLSSCYPEFSNTDFTL